MPKLLLHTCCAGCGAAVARELASEFEVELFFYNPNIWPEEEYFKRLDEAHRIALELGLKIAGGEGDYRAAHQEWLKAIKGREADPERGERCRICYRERLEKTAKFASANGFDHFASTLSVSPHKDAEAINRIGEEIAKPPLPPFIKGGKPEFLARDFKKKDGFKRACELSRELGLYRQHYCGCEYSIKHE